MPTVTLVARRSLTYAGVRHVPGETFQAHALDAKLLKAIGKAMDATEAETDTPRRRYKRRDLQPEP